MANLLANIPDAIPNEIFQDIVSTDNVLNEYFLRVTAHQKLAGTIKMKTNGYWYCLAMVSSSLKMATP